LVYDQEGVVRSNCLSVDDIELSIKKLLDNPDGDGKIFSPEELKKKPAVIHNHLFAKSNNQENKIFDYEVKRTRINDHSNDAEWVYAGL
jgi:hypothetical protein